MQELGVPFVVHTGSVIPRTDRDSAPLVQLLTEKQYRTLIETRGNPTGGDSPGLCRPGHVRGAITPEGFVSPCEWLTDFKLGNLRDQSLESIWYGPEFQAFRKNFEDEDDCTPCELRPGCGRCPAHSYLETGNLLKCAPIQRRNAEIYQEYAHATA
jgi:radical SAM protein with 4Fe4S-binding SPASM domain